MNTFGAKKTSPLLTFLLIMGTALAYSSSFQCPFLLDDDSMLQILSAPNVTLGKLITQGRPMLHLSFALNYALTGTQVFSYHALNLMIHVCTSLVLFGLIRRTLLSPKLNAGYGDFSSGLAWTIALLWAVHPLQTQSVTYLTQRGESLMGLFYLLTLYSVARSIESSERTGMRWMWPAILSSALGMATKEVMVTAPLLAILYDRIFFSKSWRELLKKRVGMYLALCTTWIVLFATIIFRERLQMPVSAGFGLQGITPLAYLISEPGVLLHYVRLAFWPRPLCFDYLWPVAENFKDAALPALVILIFFLGTVVGILQNSPLGFLGMSFFLILAPTSSVMPIKDLAAEHRMYLPLAAVLSSIVFGTFSLLNARGIKKEKSFRLILFAAIPFVILFGVLTFQRNLDYKSAISIWEDTVRKRPKNYRAQNNLGALLVNERRETEARGRFEESLAINPEYADAHVNLANLLATEEKQTDAINHYREALHLEPNNMSAHNNLANLLTGKRDFDEAIGHYREVLRLDPNNPYVHNNFGIALGKAGQLEESIVEFKEALKLKPDLSSAERNLNIQKSKQEVAGATSRSSPQL